MVDAALVLLAVYGVLGFGWRSCLQYRRTGSTGFRGVSARIGSTEWIAGVGFVVALIVVVSAPILQWARVIESLTLLGAAWIQNAGLVLAAAGLAGTVYAQLAMGDSWRIGVDERETTALVRTGPFGWVRNPIYTAMIVFGLGLALLTPNPVALAGFTLLFTTLELQVRRVEEPYLLQKHGEAYRSYTAAVGRFIPGAGLIG